MLWFCVDNPIPTVPALSCPVMFTSVLLKEWSFIKHPFFCRAEEKIDATPSLYRPYDACIMMSQLIKADQSSYKNGKSSGVQRWQRRTINGVPSGDTQSVTGL